MRIYDNNEIISKIDHTLLSRTATAAELEKLCLEAKTHGCASVCIPPCLVKRAKALYPDLTVCTVIGFPNGYNTPAVKCFEASCAVSDGADEIDMVINLCDLKQGKDKAVLEEINEVKKACDGRLLKVIIETCLLSEEEKIRVCKTVAASDADYIKTSTGFSTGGATLGDVVLLKKHCTGKKVKAAGGIKTVQDAEAFIKAGAERLGTSSLLALLLSEAHTTASGC